MSQWSGPGVLPPPNGTEPNFINPPDQQNTTIGLHTTLLTLATFCIGIRLYTRHFINHSLGLDDYFCLGGYCSALVFSGLIIWGQTNGLGRHIWDVEKSQLPKAFKALTIAEYIYFIAIASIKLSCLLLYRRVFSPSRNVLGFIWAGIVFVILAYTILFFTTLFQCWPTEKNWDKTLPGRCLPPKHLPYASGVVNVFSDLYILILPMPVVWGLNLTMSRRIRVIALFCLGIFVCIASIVRLAMTPILYSSLDATWNILQISIWAVIEIDVGVICACLLAFPAFIQHYKTSKFGSYMSNLLSIRSAFHRPDESSGITLKRHNKSIEALTAHSSHVSSTITNESGSHEIVDTRAFSTLPNPDREFMSCSCFARGGKCSSALEQENSMLKHAAQEIALSIGGGLHGVASKRDTFELASCVKSGMIPAGMAKPMYDDERAGSK